MVSQSDFDNQNEPEQSKSPKLDHAEQKSVTGKRQLTDIEVRKVGVVTIILSLITSKFFILDKLDQIRASHEAAVEYSANIVMLAPFLFVLGLALCLGGHKVLQAMKESRRSGARGYILWIIALVPVFAVQLWFESELSKMGYRNMH